VAPRADALDLGPLADFVGFHIRMAQLAVFTDFIAGQPSPPLTPGLFGVLVLIDRNPNSTQQRLCDAIGIDKSTLTATLNRLSDRGLIRRVRSTVDRRQNALVLSAKGKARLRWMLKHVKDHEKQITSRLTPEECKQLVSLLRRVG
jgi:DNA-binding MarR family transcriptional regulator